MIALTEQLTNLGRVGPAGAIGPGTIIGSAAWNVFVISAACLLAVRKAKPVTKRTVFALTGVFALWAYAWLLTVLGYWSPAQARPSTSCCSVKVPVFERS